MKPCGGDIGARAQERRHGPGAVIGDEEVGDAISVQISGGDGSLIVQALPAGICRDRVAEGAIPVTERYPGVEGQIQPAIPVEITDGDRPGQGPGNRVCAETNAPPSVLRRTPSSEELATTRSGRPSPLKSPIATASGYKTVG